MTENNWRDRVKKLGESDVSKRVRQQVRDTTPVVAHRIREVGKALSSPVPPPQTPPPPPAMPPPVLPPHALPPQQGAATQQQFAHYAPPLVQPAAVAKPTRPLAVHIAYTSLLIAAVAAVILAGLGVYGLAELRGSVDKALHLDPSGTASFYANDYVDNAETWLMASAVALGILFALAYFLFAFAVRKGHGWPRLVGTALAVLSLPAIFLGPVAVVIVGAGIISVIALWTPGAREYVAQSKAAKRFPRQR
ncbi:hypothetical protein A5634_07425 [Mycobacterium asiaticum]|uniref:DUF4064 domain-containing protein n=1 Tax=Mycobacterium asiaticum TaxID=1790 RepID=A0A1A3NMJ0_MYCAS|nr:hypothetical protein [Mycobacterium asiaticum]OBK22279.1 hypothetical protein A5634_07425 [Mycobacterium asiaticum]